MGNCHPEKTNVDLGEADVDIGFRGVKSFHITPCESLYWLLIKYIVYIMFAFKTIHVKWTFEFVFRTP